MAENEVSAGQFEDRKDAGTSAAEQVRMWLSAIDLASQDEEAWRRESEAIISRYENEKADDVTRIDNSEQSFNILFTNTETITPAIYNSTPIPDVRRRYADEDPAGKESATILERCLSYAVDDYDFDDLMEASVLDMELTGRGVDRVRYQPYFREDGQTGEQVVWEEARCEHVRWQNFRRGPANCWDDVPWVAFEQFLTKSQIKELNGKLADKVKYDVSMGGNDRDQQKASGGPEPDIFKRCRVWEIWDKENRKILFITPSYKKGPLKVDDDALELTGFFPCPRPLYAVKSATNLKPIPPFRQYRAQAIELDRVTKRIAALVEFLKVRGVRDGNIGEFEHISRAEDGELVPMADATQLYALGGDLGKAIWLMPLKEIQQVLADLRIHRQEILSTIFQITGVADIMRGQTDPNETLGAQEIKANWGSLRIQRKQKEVARYARDLLRMKSEIMANLFQPQTLFSMSNVHLPTMAEKQQIQMQAQMAQQQQQPIDPQMAEMLKKPAQEEVIQLLRSDVTRAYKIDVESDSTIRADLTRKQENMTNFMAMTGQYVQSVGPAVQAGQITPDVAVEIYAAGARNFKLGKQAEDALDKMAQNAREQARQPQQEKPSAEELKAQADEKRLQMQAQADEKKLALDGQRMQMELEFKQQELSLKQMEMAQKAELEREKMDRDDTRQQMQMAVEQQRFETDDKFRKSQAEQPYVDMDDDQLSLSEGLTSFGSMLKQMAEGIAALQQQNATIIQGLETTQQTLMLPVQAIRGPDGKINGAQRVVN